MSPLSARWADNCDVPFSVQVECSPLCSIIWIVGEQEVDREGDECTVEEEQVEEDQDKNQFTSVISTLTLVQPTNAMSNSSVGCRWEPPPALTTIQGGG